MELSPPREQRRCPEDLPVYDQYDHDRGLYDYHFQLRLLEQQNTRRAMMARIEQDSKSSPNSLMPPQSTIHAYQLAAQQVTSPLQQAYMSEYCQPDGLPAPSPSFFPSPAYHSAKSSPWTNSMMQPSSSFLHPSPAYYSANSSPAFAHQPPLAAGPSPHGPPPDVISSEYMKAAYARGLILPIEQELNWSGKSNGGQHVEFSRNETLPFQVISKIGMSLTATVDKIRCRRIFLARKTMICGRRLSVQDALVEVEHLQKLRHPHIIQLVGSYLQGKKFAVLLYPVADSDLGGFLEDVYGILSRGTEIRERSHDALAIISLWTFLGCLSEALLYIHSRATKHLDIKPGNILVKRHPSYRFGHRVYIADFGISRSFPTLDHSQTDTPVPRTPKYCAPEVWYREAHGRAADIFSLGCVFLEMLTTLCGRDLDEFTDFRSQGVEGQTAYHMTLPRVYQWAENLRGTFYRPVVDAEMEQFSSASAFVPGTGDLLEFHRDSIWLGHTLKMLAEDPEKRSLAWIPLNLNDEICSSCDGSREVYREETASLDAHEQ